jgi:aspartyl-tRNA(Asn)/glutamyl-tRNA(Gln) amidotransferase subunit C
MAITRETVLHVAKLARLSLSEAEIDRMQRDLGNILEYVKLLSELDTSNVPETLHVALESAPLRADQRHESLPNEAALGEAPRRVGPAYAVPAFVEE